MICVNTEFRKQFGNDSVLDGLLSNVNREFFKLELSCRGRDMQLRDMCLCAIPIPELSQ